MNSISTHHTECIPIPTATLIDEKALARRWSISLKTLRNWRVSGYGPAFRKIGRSVRYAMSDIQQFETDKRRLSTSDGGRDVR
ncbi:MAG: helix-turn-helix domain-containing protein [Mesorhizobium sp.]|nr:helix-turn-helix domain-containing protein [Mesorhizobium sp.]